MAVASGGVGLINSAKVLAAFEADAEIVDPLVRLKFGGLGAGSELSIVANERPRFGSPRIFLPARTVSSARLKPLSCSSISSSSASAESLVN